MDTGRAWERCSAVGADMRGLQDEAWRVGEKREMILDQGSETDPFIRLPKRRSGVQSVSLWSETFSLGSFGTSILRAVQGVSCDEIFLSVLRFFRGKETPWNFGMYSRVETWGCRALAGNGILL